MHFFINAVGHHWKHAVAKYINSDDLAKSINNLPRTKCGVVIDLHKVSKGHHIDAAKLPTLPGKQSVKVAEYFDLFLGAVFHFEGRNTESVDMVNQRKAASASINSLVALWNELFEPMQVAHADAVPTDEASVTSCSKCYKNK
jgi:hypothetical protein